jgi:membrane protein YqaA with SNARE-associated domain
LLATPADTLCRPPLLLARRDGDRLLVDDHLQLPLRRRPDPGGSALPRRWRSLGLLCGIASGCGAAVLVEIFQYLGSEFVFSRYPELLQTQAWQTASAWLQHWGLLALLIIAGSPIPQTPALLFCAFANVSTPGILVAVAIGKTVKYLFLAWATAHYPGRFIRYN